MKNFLKVGDFDPTALLVALATQPALWDACTLRTRYPESPHHAVSDILLRFNAFPEGNADIETLLVVMDGTECIAFPAWDALPQARPILFDLMRRVEGVRLGRVMITRLPPGKTIPSHVDEGAPAEYYQRFHCVLQNRPGSIFRAGNEAVYMRPGDVWWFDNQQLHSVENGSDDDRIVMIADIRTG